MAWAPPSSPTPGQTYEIGNRIWVWNSTGWAKVERNSFTRGVLLDDYRQTLVTTIRTMPPNIRAVQLQYV